MDTRALYNADASRWQRRQPNSLSDFTGRPAVFELCGDVRGLHVLDAGCGEGYCSREMRTRGAASVCGVELSDEMVKLAQAQEAALTQGIVYRQGDVRKLDFGDGTFDLVLAVFVFNYVTIAEMQAAMTEMHRVLKPGGALVFSVPHPAFPYMRAPAPPFFFDMQGEGYFSAKDRQHEGEIHCRDGQALRVQCMHKTFEDYFHALSAAGFTRMPIVRELRVLPEHLQLDPDFFGPVADLPLHVAFRATK